MNVLPKKFHGWWDYILGLSLLCVPRLFGFWEQGGVAELPPRLAGAIMIALALVTRARFGIWRVLPLSVHLGIEALLGLALVISPELLGYAHLPHQVWAPTIIAGWWIFGVACLTQGTPRLLEMITESEHQSR